MAYVLQKDYQKARLDFDRALALGPDKIAPRISRCALGAIAGDLDGALTDCNVALRIQKNNPQALDDRGLVYLKMNQLDAAIADYNAALAINPKSKTLCMGVDSLHSGMAIDQHRCGILRLQRRLILESLTYSLR
jgi:tetratricopeptide (TPR) repeat protein